MPPKPMDPTEQKQQFSFAFVRAIASAAGVGVTRNEIDDDSIDLVFSARENTRPRLEAQIKCTSKHVIRSEDVFIDLNLKNYDDLRDNNVSVPRLLIVVVVPQDVSEWLKQTEEQMVAKYSAWYISLLGKDIVANTTKVRIEIPRSQILTPQALRSLMGLSVTNNTAIL